MLSTYSVTTREDLRCRFYIRGLSVSYQGLRAEQLLHRAIRLANRIAVIARTSKISVRKSDPTMRLVLRMSLGAGLPLTPKKPGRRSSRRDHRLSS